MHVSTSTVSQQIAALAREAGTPLIEPHGRRVRLTPAGQRLAGHAVTILAALEAARLDLDPAAAPAGTVRVAAFATAVRESVLPVVRILADRHPAVLLGIHEYEPDEALGLLADDAVDLALTYDYNLAPARFDRSLATQPLGRRQWSLGTPAAQGRVVGDRARGLPPVRRSRLDRQFTEQRRRGGGPHRSLAGRLPAADHAPRGQPRTGTGHDPGRPGRRAAARRAPGAPRRGAAAARPAGGDAAALRRDSPGPLRLAAAGPRAPVAPRDLRLNRWVTPPPAASPASSADVTIARRVSGRPVQRRSQSRPKTGRTSGTKP